MGMIFAYFKGQPTEYVLKFSGGKPRAQGKGLSFYYLVRTTSIVVVPTQVRDAGFVFNELTNTFQTVTVQGSLTYRIANPAQAATLIDFAIDPRRRTYLSTDPDSLGGRIVNAVQGEVRAEIQHRSLEETLRDAQTLAGAVLARLRASTALVDMGIEVLTLNILSASPTKEVARALEADYRESLLGKADEATFARRRAAVEAERGIKERELETDTALAEQRARLIDLEGANIIKEAEAKGEALRAELAAYEGTDPKRIVALALRAMGERAEHIGSLNFTPEVLAGLLDARDR
ncbi:SPFH domain-containing protein [bacterium]|nr:MAG: SPFH domain-containing protein [bacterium]